MIPSHVLGRKFSLPIPQRTVIEPGTPPPNSATADHAWSNIVRKKGPAHWPLKLFRRFSLRPDSDPVYLSVEKALSRFYIVKDKWLRSPLRDQTIAALEQHKPTGKGWQIIEAFLIGVGSIANVRATWSTGPQGMDRFIEQLVQFLDIVEKLEAEDGVKIQAYTQETQEWSDIELQMLEHLNVTVLMVPQAEQKIGKGSFVMLPFVTWNTVGGIIGRCPPLLPTLVVGNEIERREDLLQYQLKKQTSEERRLETNRIIEHTLAFQQSHTEVDMARGLYFHFEKTAPSGYPSSEQAGICTACAEKYYLRIAERWAATIATGAFKYGDPDRSAAKVDRMRGPYKCFNL